MPIPSEYLYRQMLPEIATPATTVATILAAFEQQPDPQNWVVIVRIAEKYDVLALSDFSPLAAQFGAALLQYRLDELADFLKPQPPLIRSKTTGQEAREARDRSLPRKRLVVLDDDGRPEAIVRLTTLGGHDAGGVSPLDLLRQRTNGDPAVAGQDGIQTPPGERPDRIVNTDFAQQDDPIQPLATSAALSAGVRYYFRVHIGAWEPTSIEVAPASIQPELLADDIELQVVLFSEDFILEKSQGTIAVPRRGETFVRGEGVAALPERLGAGAPQLGERLFFGVTPKHNGVASLRCNLYYNGLLIQSRLVSAVVGAAPALDDRGAMQRSVQDFSLSFSLAHQTLGAVEPHRLSLMVNDNGNGTHAFRVFTDDGQTRIARDATLSPSELSNLIQESRERLRLVSWGKTTEWKNEAYSYGIKVPDPYQRLRADLIVLARRGAKLYHAIVNDLKGGGGRKELWELMRAPAMVQLASKHNAHDIVPIATIYDYYLDSEAQQYTICPEFEASLRNGRPLIGEPCFNGACEQAASKNRQTVICPGGFWGFRHDIGMPHPVRNGGPELATRIRYAHAAQMDIAFYSDFQMVSGHLALLEKLGYRISKESDRERILNMFQRSSPQLIYFYCHGVERDTMPYLQVGTKADDAYISTDNFSNFQIEWPDQRPLVLLNGCQTAALTPDKAMSFVKAFVEDTSAAGVIGTEITVFEQLAQDFATTFLTQFLAGTPAGRAVRIARLEILAQHNPLGLVYMPHVYAGLRLIAAM